jgi:hypothetical protein
MNSDLYFIDEAENDMGRCLVLKAPWSDNFIDVIKMENISVLRLTESMGWKGKDISFLENLQDIDLRGVEIYAWDVKDITPLRFIPNLEYLGLQCKFTKAPDFSGFDQLKAFKLFWRPKAKSVFDCLNLKFLNIVNYPAEDLQVLKNFTGLMHLQLTSRKLISLAGIEALKSLKILDLAGCSILESITNIEKCRNLEIVELENCKKLYDIYSLGELTNLKDLVLTDCSKVKSLKPLVKCRLLVNLIFAGDTIVEDGELTPLLTMPKLKRMRFVDKRHYSHKRELVETMLL